MKTKLLLSNLLPVLSADVQEALYAAIKAAGGDPLKAEVCRKVTTHAQVEKSGQRLAYFSTRDLDRDREIVDPDGLDIRQWMAPGAGVILECHNYSKPQIGKCSEVKSDGYGLLGRPEFAPTEDGKTWSLLQSFMPLSYSIGFVPLAIARPGDADWPAVVQECARKWPEFKTARDNVRSIVRRAMMLETSVVPLPCNVNAFDQEVAKALSDGKITEADAAVVRKSAASLIEKPEDQPKPDAEGNQQGKGKKPNPHMPGGSFTACVAIMEDNGHSSESAHRICGALQSERESFSAEEVAGMIQELHDRSIARRAAAPEPRRVVPMRVVMRPVREQKMIACPDATLKKIITDVVDLSRGRV